MRGRPEWRGYRAVLGISPKVSFGVDGLMVPRERRASLGRGLSLDAHLGKRVLFIDHDHACLNRPLDGKRTRRGLMIGAKWGVIDLQRRAVRPQRVRRRVGPAPQLPARAMDIVPALFLVTFAFALVFGIWQYRKARKAREEHHRSASAKATGEPRAPDRPR